MYMILDLDNCISNDLHRIPRINWQHDDLFRRYHDYHSLSPFDEIGNADLLKTECDIAIFTARPVHYRTITEEWLRRNGVTFKHLLMRNDNDHRHSLQLKQKQLEWLRSLYGVPFCNITCAYDDRLDVVAMYQAAGINAEVRAIHDTCAYTQPKGRK